MTVNNMPDMCNKLEVFKGIAKLHYYDGIL